MTATDTVLGVSSAERIGCLRSARDLIDLRYAEPLDLDRMAAEAGYSKFHFARAFRDLYGETAANYLHPSPGRAGEGPLTLRQPDGDRGLHARRLLATAPTRSCSRRA
jgi:Bacterial regulatory helix-turn-helix proteins, AraC family